MPLLSLPVIMMSSTYMNIIIIFDSALLKSKGVSLLEFLNPQELKAPFSLSNHALGACLNPYKAFFSLQMWFDLFLFSKPLGCGMYTVYVKPPFKTALFMSTCLRNQSLFTVKVRMIMIVVFLTTRPNVSLQSSPGVCRNPFCN